MLVAKADQKTARSGRALEMTLLGPGAAAGSRSVLGIQFPTWPW